MCRSFVQSWKEDGVEKPTGRFNVGVTTLNLAYAALEAKGDKEAFFKKLDEYCELAYDANMVRVERLLGTKAKVAPILWQYGALATLEPEDVIDPLIFGGKATCSIGYAALAEALEVVGDISKEFGISVMKVLTKKAVELSERSNIHYSIYGSPVEATTEHFAKGIKASFPEYHYEKDYITNSFHLPVYTDIEFEDKFEYESDFYMYSPGGNVNNVEVPNLSNNLEAFHGLIKAAYNKMNYLIVNQPVDKCFECGYEGEFSTLEDGLHCPVCGNNNPETANAIRRISGYIHSALARPANAGKYSEQRERAKNM